MRFSKLFLVGVIGAALGVPVSYAVADTTRITAKVRRVLVHGDDTFGGCMANLSVNVKDSLPSCGNSWVTFSCSGDFTDPVRAYRMLDQAQLALSTGKKVYVQVRDNQKHNGYCFAKRIDVLN